MCDGHVPPAEQWRQRERIAAQHRSIYVSVLAGRAANEQIDRDPAGDPPFDGERREHLRQLFRRERIPDVFRHREAGCSAVRKSVVETPPMSTSFVRAVAPRTMRIFDLGIENARDRTVTTASLASPRSGGAVTRTRRMSPSHPT